MNALEQGFYLDGWEVRPQAGLLCPPGAGLRQSASGAVHIEPKAMRVLLALAASAGEFVSKDKLIDQVWDGRPVSDDVLTRAISALRGALNDDARKPHFIETRSNVGYRLLVPVRSAQPRRRFAQLAAISAALLLVAALVGLSSGPPTQPPGALPRTIAVLPFMHLSDSSKDSYLAAAMTESLILNLAQLTEFQVISRTSVMHLADYRGRIETVAAELGADLLVEGSVQTTDDQVRVVAQLIEPYSDGHVWAQRYDRPIDDVLKLQQEVAATIALQIGDVTDSAGPDADPLPAAAMHDYLQARFQLATEQVDSVIQAEAGFALLSEQFPDFAPAYLGRARALLYLFKRHQRDPDLLRRGLAQAQRFEAMAGASAESHRCIGQILLMLNWDLQAARERYQSALALNPSDTVARRRYAWLLVGAGDYALATAQIRQIRMLDPLYYDSAELATLLLYAGDTSAAVAEFERLDQAHTLGKPELRTMGMAYLAAGEQERAADAFVRMLIAADSLDTAQAARLRDMPLPQLYQHIIESKPFKSPIVAAGFHTLLGDEEAAMAHLQESLAVRDPYLLYLRCMPEFKSLHSHPQFIAVLQTTGVVPQQAVAQHANRLSSANLSNPQRNPHDN